MQEVRRHRYLENERSLRAAVLGSERFAGRVRMDVRGNAVFPHFDQDGLCGYEIKNTNFTGFAAGGEKGLWFSHARRDDTRLVFCESAIDALSHAALFPDAGARYASIGGKPNPVQPELIRGGDCPDAGGIGNRGGNGFRCGWREAGRGGARGSRIVGPERFALCRS